MIQNVSFAILLLGAALDAISLLRLLWRLLMWSFRRRPGPPVGLPLLPLAAYAVFFAMRQAGELELHWGLLLTLVASHLVLQFGVIPLLVAKTGMFRYGQQG